jgi:3-deoxy-manno-octulosonate cytidylyltransferase (CMP-KDO synthetase)
MPGRGAENLSYHIVIPARMASERLPGKPLADLAGKPMIEHVYARACESSAESVVIATDDKRVFDAARSFGARAAMTSVKHASGSDRINECVRIMDWPDETVVVNLQGDEPEMPAQCLDQVAELLLSNPSAQMASLFWPLQDAAEISDPNVVKVVNAIDGSAIFFSRSVVPYPRAWESLDAAITAGHSWHRHIGLYAYTVAGLRDFAKHEPTPLEQLEKLEQLRVLEAGGRIKMARACCFIPAGIDTPEDLERLRNSMK